MVQCHQINTENFTRTVYLGQYLLIFIYIVNLMYDHDWYNKSPWKSCSLKQKRVLTQYNKHLCSLPSGLYSEINGQIRSTSEISSQNNCLLQEHAVSSWSEYSVPQNVFAGLTPYLSFLSWSVWSFYFVSRKKLYYHQCTTIGICIWV